VIAVAPPDGVAEALGVSPRATFSAGALGDLIAVHDDEAAGRPLRHSGPRRDRPYRPPRRHPRHHRDRGCRRSWRRLRASSARPTASLRTRWRAAPTPRSRRCGRSSSVATTSSGCRPRSVAASCAGRSMAIACTSPADAVVVLGGMLTS